MTIVFKKAEPSDNHVKLQNTSKRWLIRESRIDGMITVDFLSSKQSIEPGSMRFAFVGDHWVAAVSGEQAKAFNSTPNSFTKIYETLSTHYKNYSASLFAILEQEGFDVTANDILKPTPPETTKNAGYSGYLIKDEEKPHIETRTADKSAPPTPLIWKVENQHSFQKSQDWDRPSQNQCPNANLKFY